jgi:hypothetical protein
MAGYHSAPPKPKAQSRVLRPVPTPLSPRLEELLARETDKDLAGRLRKIFEASWRAVGRLSELETADHELVSDDGGPDLGMYEKVAPSVAATLAEMNALVQSLRLLFPADEVLTEPREMRINGTVQAASAHLQTETASFAEHMRDPRVVSDAWELLQQIQLHRQRFREAVGGLTFDLASAIGECRRDEVEPGYLEALDQALRLRVATTDLRNMLQRRRKAIEEAMLEDVDWNFAQLKRELEKFRTTITWAALRAHDRQHLVMLMQALWALPAEGVRQVDLLRAMQPMLEFADRFSSLSRRELLQSHDREVLAACGVLLERAQLAQRHQPKEAIEAFIEAAQRGSALYGRSPDFDALLYQAQVEPPKPEALDSLITQFLIAVARLSQE